MGAKDERRIVFIKKVDALETIGILVLSTIYFVITNESSWAGRTCYLWCDITLLLKFYIVNLDGSIAYKLYDIMKYKNAGSTIRNEWDKKRIDVVGIFDVLFIVIFILSLMCILNHRTDEEMQRIICRTTCIIYGICIFVEQKLFQYIRISKLTKQGE